MAEVTKILSPWTMGDDQPRPGIFFRHATCSVSLQVLGRSELVLTPDAPGPRNCGQSCAVDAGAIKVDTPRKKSECMGIT